MPIRCPPFAYASQARQARLDVVVPVPLKAKREGVPLLVEKQGAPPHPSFGLSLMHARRRGRSVGSIYDLRVQRPGPVNVAGEGVRHIEGVAV